MRCCSISARGNESRSSKTLDSMVDLRLVWAETNARCGSWNQPQSKAGHVPSLDVQSELRFLIHGKFPSRLVSLCCLVTAKPHSSSLEQVMCCMFFALVILFSGFITIAGVVDPACVRIGGKEFGEAGTQFADAVRDHDQSIVPLLVDSVTAFSPLSTLQFALSWTTFSTVGYGSTYPALGYQNNNPTNCFFINFICSLESLLGVLYSGFCGAILFGKVLRIQSQAQVIFSDPILIRYGPGLFDGIEEESEGAACPILEFRVVNRLFSEAGGEIMDATLNVVANIDADDADPTLRNALEGINMSRPGGAYSGRSSFTSGDTSSENSDSIHTYSSTTSNAKSVASSTIHRLLDPLKTLTRRDHHTVDEDPSSRLVNKQIFSKMLIEATEHPFFKRVWLARHVLDENSPILKHRVRRQIRRNGGSWPDRLNNCNAIRDSLKFNQILVSLNGVSNVSASDVYAQKIYDFVDVNIGKHPFKHLPHTCTEHLDGINLNLLVFASLI